MSSIQPAKSSPRVENGVLRWYNGDCFTVDWTINLTKDDEEYEYNEDDELVFNFYDRYEEELIYSFSFTNIEDNTVTLDFTEDISALFDAGSYTYCVKFNGYDGEVVTLYAKLRAEVDQCH